jgi:uncharacterized protein
MTVVSNTSPITNLSGIEQLDLLHQLYGTVTIPQAVYNEMAGISKTVPGAIAVQTLSWITTQPVTDSNQVEVLRSILDQGESEAIALALELNTELLIIDEKPGRAIARRYGLNIIGVLGVLIEAKHQELIIAVKPLMDQLIDQLGFRVSRPLYAAVLQSVDEN